MLIFSKCSKMMRLLTKLFWFNLIALNTVRVDSTCGSTCSYSELSIAFQQTQGTIDTTSYAHQITLAAASSGTCSAIQGAMLLSGATSTCPSTCLTSLQAYTYTNSSFVDIAMLRPIDVSLYPDYVASGSIIYCASTSGNCGATIPYFAFYSATYGDHYISTSTSLPDSTYNFDNSGLPVCYGWKMPSSTADISTVASAYLSTVTQTTCNVPAYFGLISTTITTTVPVATSTGTTVGVSTAGTTSVVTGSTVTTVNAAGTSGTTGSVTAATNSGAATTVAGAAGSVTTAASGSGAATTVAGSATTVAGSSGSGTTVAGNTGSVKGTTAAGSSNTVVGSGTTVSSNTGNGATTAAKPQVVVTDASGNPVIASTEPSNKNGTRVWVWVVLGVGLFVILLMILGMLYFTYTNFLKPVKTQKIRVNPYDRDLYTSEGMSEPPPVPVSSMPAAAST